MAYIRGELDLTVTGPKEDIYQFGGRGAPGRVSEER